MSYFYTLSSLTLLFLIFLSIHLLMDIILLSMYFICLLLPTLIFFIIIRAFVSPDVRSGFLSWTTHQKINQQWLSILSCQHHSTSLYSLDYGATIVSLNKLSQNFYSFFSVQYSPPRWKCRVVTKILIRLRKCVQVYHKPGMSTPEFISIKEKNVSRLTWEEQNNFFPVHRQRELKPTWSNLLIQAL